MKRSKNKRDGIEPISELRQALDELSEPSTGISDTGDMDRWLSYRNMLCAEDHLQELLHHSQGPAEHEFLAGIYGVVKTFRKDVMPHEKDDRYHCVVKHLSIALEAAREAGDTVTSSILYDVCIDCLEKLWGRKIEICERCKTPSSVITEEGQEEKDD